MSVERFLHTKVSQKCMNYFYQVTQAKSIVLQLDPQLQVIYV